MEASYMCRATNIPVCAHSKATESCPLAYASELIRSQGAQIAKKPKQVIQQCHAGRSTDSKHYSVRAQLPLQFGRPRNSNCRAYRLPVIGSSTAMQVLAGIEAHSGPLKLSRQYCLVTWTGQDHLRLFGSACACWKSYQTSQ